MDTTNALTTAIAVALTGHRMTHMVIDLGRVPFLDMAGLSALPSGRTAAAQAGASFRVIRPQRLVRRLLHLNDTCQILSVTPAPSGRRPWALAAGQ
jgi:anti-anti-sigma factor